MQVSSDTWLATLREVAGQAALAAQQQVAAEAAAPAGGAGRAASGAVMAGGDWVEVEAAAARAPAPPAGPGAEGEDWSSVWPERQWQIAFEILFCQAPAALAGLRPHQDDLLFFVYTEEELAAAARQGAEAPPPLFVRRASAKQLALPADLAWGGPGAAAVDWRASVLLNAALQTGFCLTVATCRKDELGLLVSGEAPPPGSSMRQVAKQVHPCPSRVHVNLDDTRAESAAPTAAYPELCFAVDNFADTFQSLVLSDPNDCYCVLLHADVSSSWRPPVGGAASGGSATSSSGRGGSTADPAAAASEALAGLSLRDSPADAGASGGGSGGRAGAAGGSAPPVRWRSGEDGDLPAREVLVFSGFVSHSQLAGALAPKAADPLRRLFGGGGEARAPDVRRVVMRGPEGLGGADVVVTNLGLAPPPGHAKGAAGGGAAVPGAVAPADRGGRSPLSRLVDAARRAAGGGPSTAPAPPQRMLSCALTTLLVPVDLLAAAIFDALHSP
eukprot:scaffold2.g7371.t1